MNNNSEKDKITNNDSETNKEILKEDVGSTDIINAPENKPMETSILSETAEPLSDHA